MNKWDGEWLQGGSSLSVMASAIWGFGGSLENELDYVLKNKVIWQSEKALIQQGALNTLLHTFEDVGSYDCN